MPRSKSLNSRFLDVAEGFHDFGHCVVALGGVNSSISLITSGGAWFLSASILKSCLVAGNAIPRR